MFNRKIYMNLFIIGLYFTFRTILKFLYILKKFNIDIISNLGFLNNTILCATMLLLMTFNIWMILSISLG